MRFASVNRGNIDDLATLVTWTREKHLTPQKQKVCRLILKIDPNHEMARRELGYTVFENEWILEKELRKKQIQLGLVKYKGEWVSKEARNRLEFKRDAQLLDTLFKSVQSDNRIVVDYAVRKIMGCDVQRPYELLCPTSKRPKRSSAWSLSAPWQNSPWSEKMENEFECWKEKIDIQEIFAQL